jgi:RHS repeat-associated protein
MTSRTAGGQTTYFLYAGDSLIAEVDGTGTVTRAYTWGGEGLISTQSGNVPTFARFDPLGNLSGQLNGAGAVIQETAYKAYGGSLGTPAANTPFAFQGISGAYTDGSYPGVVLSGSRPYLPDVGRFASPSASGSDGVTNPYNYAGGNPAGYAAPGVGDDDIYESDYGSYGAMYGAFARKGAQELTSMPAYQPGSDDRRKLSAMACAIPYVGELHMGIMVLTGHDYAAGTCLSPGERAFTLACLAAPGVANKLGSKLEKMCIFGRGCFVAGTLVQVATLEEAAAQLAKHESSSKKGKKGKSSETLHTVTKPIEQVREGDLVASRNQVSGKTELRRVVATSRHTVMKLIVLSLADARTGKVVETITTTAEHPFAVKGKGFVVAGQLAIGNAIVTRAGPALVVKSKQVQAQPKGVAVYNFSVDGDHNYFVGTANGGTWVHNASICDPIKLTIQKLDFGQFLWN